MTSKLQKEEERPFVTEGALFITCRPAAYGEYGDQKAESATSDKVS
jgi:hypothetical protein